MIAGNRGLIVIAAIPDALPGVNRLWRALLIDDTLVLPIKDRLYAGDMSNSAIFFGERYYAASLPVATLGFLAARIVLEGHRQNELLVDGLEVLVSEDGKESILLNDDELQILRHRSIHASTKLAELLLRRD